jgi:DNA polymerase III subunit epsilon
VSSADTDLLGWLTAPGDRRRVIMLDTETDGLDEDLNRPVEVGWFEWGPDYPAVSLAEHGVFVPPHTLAHADPEALRINGYDLRIGHRRRDYTYPETRRLHRMLSGATLAGANPRFDAAMLRHLFREADLHPLTPWHHRLVDVEAYAGGLLGFPPWNLPGLRTLCQLLGLPEPDHGAWGDARAAGLVLSAVLPVPEGVPA